MESYSSVICWLLTQVHAFSLETVKRLCCNFHSVLLIKSHSTLYIHIVYINWNKYFILLDGTMFMFSSFSLRLRRPKLQNLMKSHLNLVWAFVIYLYRLWLYSLLHWDIYSGLIILSQRRNQRIVILIAKQKIPTLPQLKKELKRVCHCL